MLERRNTPRLRTYLGAKISFDASYCVVDCLVRDLSQNGAKLVLSETAILPGYFDLIVPKKGWTLRAELVWRGTDRIGVAFLNNGSF
ncbi:PilZ domain-containing protein [Methylobacterium radiotolerans]|uniref:PilZ domain-containing protein n=1 Tax=Methylobacterium radiotolerans TaxID=31998 RepID=UPI00399CC107